MRLSCVFYQYMICLIYPLLSDTYYYGITERDDYAAIGTILNRRYSNFCRIVSIFQYVLIDGGEVAQLG